MKLFLNEDCMDVMKRYPDGYFDLAIVDPPYFSGPEKRKFYGRKVSPIGVSRLYGETSEWQIPNRDYFDELFRVSKNQIIWGVNYFNYSFGPGRIVWDKVNGQSSFSDCEIAYCSLHALAEKAIKKEFSKNDPDFDIEKHFVEEVAIVNLSKFHSYFEEVE